MSIRQAPLRTLALAVVLLAGLAAPVAAHTADGGRIAGTGGTARVNAAEVAALGSGHAEQHALARARERAARGRWSRLSPRQRMQRLAAARRETAALNEAIGERARDDVGYWEPSLIALPEYAIHASVLPTGRILIFGREPLVGTGPTATRSNKGSASVFDPATGVSEHLPPPPIPENPDPDNPGQNLAAPLFCAGQALLSDGRVLVVGGNLSDPKPGSPQFAGLNYTFIFDPWTETWRIGPKMSNGRWYPTLTKLPSGDVLILSGLDENGQGAVNKRLDIYRPGVPGTAPLVALPAGLRAGPLGLYPGMFLMPDGNVALAGPGSFVDSAILDTSKLTDPTESSAWTQIPSTNASQSHYGGSPVIEPDMNAFFGSWNILVTAGADSNGGSGFFPARSTVDRLVSGPGTPLWTHDPQDDQQQARFYPNDVLLPDGGIAAIGGGLGGQYNGPGGSYYVGDPPPPELRQVELRRPGERTWRLGAAQQEYRTYHSTASLLPDGRIWSAGDDGHEGPLDAPVPPAVRRDSAEIYWPPYLFDGDDCALRPIIRAVGATAPPAGQDLPWATLTYGEQFGIFSDAAQAGMQAVMVAPSQVTHGVDMNQRVVALRVTQTISLGGLNALTPPDARVAPPGYYLLFLVEASGTPSQARWVQLLAPADAAAVRGGAAPATVSARRPDAKGRRCTNPDGTSRSEPDPPPAPDETVTPPPPLPPPPPRAPRSSSKLALTRAAIVRSSRELDVVAQISALAAGRVRFDLFAAGRHTRLSAPIDRTSRRVRLRSRIPRAQAALGTGILTMSYDGDTQTRPLSVRLRAAPNAAALRVTTRPSYAGGRLRAVGTISARAGGSVRVEVQFERDGAITTVARSAPIVKGRWRLDARLPAATVGAIAARSGTLDATVLFTGDAGRRMRGEMRAYQLLAGR